MSNSCIIFACTIVDETRLHVLHKFLTAFKTKFSDSDIFIGINHCSVYQIEDIINSYELNVVFMQRCDESMYSFSDASAYQLALRGLYAATKEYDNYWFVHTKSGVNAHSDYLADWYIHNFLGNRGSVETFVSDNTGIGSYGMLGLEFDDEKYYKDTDCEIHLFNNTLTDRLPCTHANFFYIHSIYMISKLPMQQFFKHVSDTWFTTKLDRYYFEGVFPFIVSRTGYFPYIENRYSCTATDLQEGIDNWIFVNNLEKYKKYTNIFKTAYIFHQLQPPYVNSIT